MNSFTKEQLDALLLALVGSEELVKQWWESPNRAFNGLRPLDVDLQEVEKYILPFCMGNY